jgi:hypothetical protein
MRKADEGMNPRIFNLEADPDDLGSSRQGKAVSVNWFMANFASACVLSCRSDPTAVAQDAPSTKQQQSSRCSRRRRTTLMPELPQEPQQPFR